LVARRKKRQRHRSDDDPGHQWLSSLDLASGEWLQFVEASYNCIDRAETFSTQHALLERHLEGLF